MSENNQTTFIPFNKPAMVGEEVRRIVAAVQGGKISGNGHYSQKVQAFMEHRFAIGKVLLTTSCTDALEMAAMLLNLEPGDEVIVPSFSFVSTANAFVLRGARPVFADIEQQTLNIDPNSVKDILTDRTKAIVPIHYGGGAADLDALQDICEKSGAALVEDAAQCVGAKYKGRALGSFGVFGAYSFHETKNLHCGEGGALTINRADLAERAEILWEKGTNRSKFFRGEVDKYTWVDIGSSFLLSDLQAAYLDAQFDHLDEILENRLRLFENYRSALSILEEKGIARLPRFHPGAEHNGHIFYLLCNSERDRNGFIGHLRGQGIHAVFHYLPLHLSPMGKKLGGKPGQCPVTERVSCRLVRLPLYHSLTEAEQGRVIDSVREFFGLGK